MFVHRVISVYLYHFCLPVLGLFNCTMSTYLYYIWLLVPQMSGYLFEKAMSYCLQYVPSCLYDVCLPVWCLLNTMSASCNISSFLDDFCSTVWCLLTCILCAQRCDTCSPVWYLFGYMMSAYLYDVCLAVWFLPIRMISAQLCHVCLPVWCWLDCMTSSYLCGVCSTILYCVCLP